MAEDPVVRGRGQQGLIYRLPFARTMDAETLQGHFVVAPGGRRTAVILSIQQYEQLLEDLHDLAVVAERRRERPVPLAELRRRLKRHGRL